MVVVYVLAGIGVLALLAAAVLLLLALIVGTPIEDPEVNVIERQEWRHVLSQPVECEKCGHETVCVVCEKAMRDMLLKAGLPPRKKPAPWPTS